MTEVAKFSVPQLTFNPFVLWEKGKGWTDVFVVRDSFTIQSKEQSKLIPTKLSSFFKEEVVNLFKGILYLNEVVETDFDSKTVSPLFDDLRRSLRCFKIIGCISSLLATVAMVESIITNANKKERKKVDLEKVTNQIFISIGSTASFLKTLIKYWYTSLQSIEVFSGISLISFLGPLATLPFAFSDLLNFHSSINSLIFGCLLIKCARKARDEELRATLKQYFPSQDVSEIDFKEVERAGKEIIFSSLVGLISRVASLATSLLLLIGFVYVGFGAPIALMFTLSGTTILLPLVNALHKKFLTFQIRSDYLSIR